MKNKIITTIMKNDAVRFCLALLISMLPFGLSCLLYQGGLAITMMVHVLQIFISALNFQWTKRIVSFSMLNMVMLASSTASTIVQLHLYYTNISSDGATLMIGRLGVQDALVLGILLTLIGIVYRLIKRRKELADPKKPVSDSYSLSKD